MSRAGKFIPGGGGGKTAASAARTGPIRAPEASAPEGGPPSPDGKKRPFAKGSLVKPVAKHQRMPIVVMSAVVFLILVSAALYTAYIRMQRDVAVLRAQVAAANAATVKAQQEAETAKRAAVQHIVSERASLTVDSNPTGATVTIGDFRKQTPASFSDIVPGTVTMVIHDEGFEDYHQTVTVSADQPSSLGTIQLVPMTGALALSSPQSDVSYKMTGPSNYEHDGQLPDKIDKLPIGDYSIVVAYQDWTLPAVSVSIHDHDDIKKEIKFPYAKLEITSSPAGATVRQGRTLIGQTPVSVDQLRPGDFNYSIDLPPYTLQRITVHLTDFANVTKQVKLVQEKDFIAACGMPMVWIPDGGFWAGKYEVRQSEYEAITGSNPSTFRRPTRPVETVSWEQAMAFADELTKSEARAGRLPAGFHYSLPKESQWDTFNADANIDLAATSRITTLASTQDVGYSEPNKYGLYDTLGNVWEWCLDNFDANGNHSLRGGCWLSSAEHFPSADTRNAGGAKYADQFTGFRVVLVPN